MNTAQLLQSPDFAKGGREVIEHCITGYYVDRDLMRGQLVVEVALDGQAVKKVYNLRKYEDFRDVMKDARGWRDALLSSRTDLPKSFFERKAKRERKVSPGVELARRDVEHARAKYGHVEDSWWTERTYIP